METKQDYKQALLGTRHKQRLFIPDTEIEIELRMISTKDILESQAAKQSFLKARDLLQNGLADAIEENVQVTFRSAYLPDSNQRFFESPDVVRDLPQEHLLFIADQYKVLSEKHNPSLKEYSQEELERLKKKLLNGEDLIGLNYFQLLSLCNHLVQSPSTSGQPVKSSLDANQEISPQTKTSSTTSSQQTLSEKSPSESEQENQKNQMSESPKTNTKSQVVSVLPT